LSAVLIRALIETAFADVRRDEHCTLHQAQWSDHYGDDSNMTDEQLDPETDWRDIPPGAIDECDAALSHSTLQAWHFFIPAYMRRALDLLDTDEWLPGSVIFHLTLSHDGPLRHRSLERYEQLTEAQQAAVIAFLEYIRDYPATNRWNSDSAVEALKSYWSLPVNERPSRNVILLAP
jgi:uncharacterized protein DUF6714